MKKKTITKSKKICAFMQGILRQSMVHNGYPVFPCGTGGIDGMSVLETGISVGEGSAGQ